MKNKDYKEKIKIKIESVIETISSDDAATANIDANKVFERTQHKVLLIKIKSKYHSILENSGDDGHLCFLTSCLYEIISETLSHKSLDNTKYLYEFLEKFHNSLQIISKEESAPASSYLNVANEFRKHLDSYISKIKKTRHLDSKKEQNLKQISEIAYKKACLLNYIQRFSTAKQESLASSENNEHLTKFNKKIDGYKNRAMLADSREEIDGISDKFREFGISLGPRESEISNSPEEVLKKTITIYVKLVKKIRRGIFGQLKELTDENFKYNIQNLQLELFNDTHDALTAKKQDLHDVFTTSIKKFLEKLFSYNTKTREELNCLFIIVNNISQSLKEAEESNIIIFTNKFPSYIKTLSSEMENLPKEAPRENNEKTKPVSRSEAEKSPSPIINTNNLKKNITKNNAKPANCLFRFCAIFSSLYRAFEKIVDPLDRENKHIKIVAFILVNAVFLWIPTICLAAKSAFFEKKESGEGKKAKTPPMLFLVKTQSVNNPQKSTCA